MRGITHRGFTVVEVMLFLAISGLLLIIAFAGTGVAIERARFQDASRQTQAHIQSYYSDVLNGVSFRPDATTCNPATGEIPAGTDPYGSSECILLGIVAVFPTGSSEIISYYVVGAEPPGSGPSVKSVGEQLYAYNPVVVSDASLVSRFQLPWQSQIKSGCYANDTVLDVSSEINYVDCASTDAVNALALLRSPESGEIRQYAFAVGDPTFGTDKDLISFIAFNPIDPADSKERPLNICMIDPDGSQTTVFRVGGRYGGSQASVVAAIDVSDIAAAGACQ